MYSFNWHFNPKRRTWRGIVNIQPLDIYCRMRLSYTPVCISSHSNTSLCWDASSCISSVGREMLLDIEMSPWALISSVTEFDRFYIDLTLELGVLARSHCLLPPGIRPRFYTFAELLSTVVVAMVMLKRIPSLISRERDRRFHVWCTASCTLLFLPKETHEYMQKHASGEGRTFVLMLKTKHTPSYHISVVSVLHRTVLMGQTMSQSVSQLGWIRVGKRCISNSAENRSSALSLINPLRFSVFLF